jgi:hypothetical protein
MSKYKQLLERSVWTFVQAAAASIIVSQGFGADVWKVAAVAGGLAVVKCIVAFQVGDKNSAAL